MGIGRDRMKEEIKKKLKERGYKDIRYMKLLNRTEELKEYIVCKREEEEYIVDIKRIEEEKTKLRFYSRRNPEREWYDITI